MDHHRLEIYRLAREIHRDICRLLARVPRGNADLVKQLKRSAASITHNIAEGAAEFAPREKARIYRLAKREVGESGSALENLVDRGDVRQSSVDPILAKLEVLTGKLVRLIKNMEARAEEEAPSNARNG
jgi:four helix bundle protein